MDFFKHIPTPVIIILVGLSSAFAAVSILPIISYLKEGSVKSFNAVLGFGGGVYLTGNICKFAIFGPSFIRWHLGDFGFAICVISVIYMILFNGSNVDESIIGTKQKNLIKEWMEEIRGNFVKSIIGGFAVCICYEALSGYLTSIAPENNSGIGKFDIIDVAAYLLAAILLLATVVIQNQVSRKKLQLE